MENNLIKRNERDWAGQLISWIKTAIDKKETIFQDATNDTGIKLESGRTKFPDVLLFTDKISGVIFNGWELKFPDTSVEDNAMLNNALEKAKKIQSDSFVTWNGTEAIIWGIKNKQYTVDNLEKIKEYPKEPSITVREDLSNPINFSKNEELLKRRAYEILHDLEQLFKEGLLRPAIDITGNVVDAIQKASFYIIPQFQKSIESAANTDMEFRKEFNSWKIYESSTLNILSSSSRNKVKIVPEQVLAKFMFYDLIGKILFYLTLSENLSGELKNLRIKNTNDLKFVLESYFDRAKAIDYQAIFQPYFTDSLDYSEVTNRALYQLIGRLTEFDFRILPTGVIGNILENLVPKEEKQKFGQYFTSELLANLVAFPVIHSNSSVVFDPTCGTGTFLNSFYNILGYYGVKEHSTLLNQIWGNDISHFPAILAVMNLYKQNVRIVDNFPRIIRNDFFNLKVGDAILFPDSKDYLQRIPIKIPLFDGIASNFPFIQQEDIPKELLSKYFEKLFKNTQSAFLGENGFKINERSDYFTYCIYNSYCFLKENGVLSGITSNAWLGKEYGFQFKKFLLDNFHIKYVIRSAAEHWFSDSKVSTIFFVIEKCTKNEATKFVTLNFKLSDFFNNKDLKTQFEIIENFYTDIDLCNNPKNLKWEQNAFFKTLYINRKDKISVNIVSKAILMNSLQSEVNWTEFFISDNLFSIFDKYLTNYYPKIFDVIRGERTGWNKMFIIDEEDKKTTYIDNEYLVPMIKTPTELHSIFFPNSFSHFFFVCRKKYEFLDNGTKKWIDKFEKAPNKNGKQTISEANSAHKPYWYSLNPKTANIITAINPYQRFFFTFSKIPFVIDQRLVAMRTTEKYDCELIAALLNSVLTYLLLEMRGTSRNLGALDLNANYFKKLRTLDPDLLNDEQKESIISAFRIIQNREVDTIFEEIKRSDRKHFDTVIFKAYGINIEILDIVYDLLLESVNDRINLKNK